ncbi:phosphatase PAP2 family protein [Pontibacter sp. E15-1]|uniref:phosphatase PAP2 family protein n=1 Tax=Pontibacter sp. E15-1 TaxID=2919918 RepID=UPI001F4F77C8|nr:phosphatase PAP2 family protein [Pontibacter sp. E15-1]MCJ8164706.1 phosphatase PAP2 family protein [Pontibacter sp. E15-1]
MKNPLSGYVKQAIGKLKHQPLVRRLREQYPGLWRFLMNRFNTRVFLGLPFTLISLVFVLNIALLSELTESVLESAWIVTLDETFTGLLFKVRSEALSQVLYAFTQLGEQETVFIVGGVVSAIFLYRRNFVALFVFWFTLAGVGISTRYGKTFFSRERPSEVAYYAVEHFSFPSGHATTVLAMYGLLAYFLYRHYHTHPWRELVLWLAGILIVIVGFSRIYLGVHFLSDVLAGFLLGALWLLVGVSLMEVMIYDKKRKARRREQ